MGKFGKIQAAVVGHMGFCSQCRNKAEVHLYEGDNPDPICEDCHRENMKLEKIIADKERVAVAISNGQPYPALAQPGTGPTVPVTEREKYINCIKEKSTAPWIDNFINEVVEKQILKFDFEMVLRNERWFTVLDLRRHALTLDPHLDDPPKPTQHSPAITAMNKARERKKKVRGGAKHVETP